MKNRHSAVSMILAACLCLSMSVAAFAASGSTYYDREQNLSFTVPYGWTNKTQSDLHGADIGETRYAFFKGQDEIFYAVWDVYAELSEPLRSMTDRSMANMSIFSLGDFREMMGMDSEDNMSVRLSKEEYADMDWFVYDYSWNTNHEILYMNIENGYARIFQMYADNEDLNDVRSVMQSVTIGSPESDSPHSVEPVEYEDTAQRVTFTVPAGWSRSSDMENDSIMYGFLKDDSDDLEYFQYYTLDIYDGFSDELKRKCSRSDVQMSTMTTEDLREAVLDGDESGDKTIKNLTVNSVTVAGQDYFKLTFKQGTIFGVSEYVTTYMYLKNGYGIYFRFGSLENNLDTNAIQSVMNSVSIQGTPYVPIPKEEDRESVEVVPSNTDYDTSDDFAAAGFLAVLFGLALIGGGVVVTVLIISSRKKKTAAAQANAAWYANSCGSTQPAQSYGYNPYDHAYTGAPQNTVPMQTIAPPSWEQNNYRNGRYR